jgi:mannose-6-phosphate isomerase-like protein (cupin superfamily)
MRHATSTLTLAAAFAFGAGLLAAPLAQHALGDAHAQAAGLQPAVIDLGGMKHDDLPATGNPDMHAKGLVVTSSGTIGIQSGNVKKHYHADADEIQYIIEGSGAMWLGKERRDFKAGSLIIIPKGTAHGGTIVSSGPVKAIAIKLPPQKSDDTHFVD